MRKVRVPKLRLHEPTGQGVVTLSGKDFYLMDLSTSIVRTGTLSTSDYALAAVPDAIRKERNRLDDLLGWAGGNSSEKCKGYIAILYACC